MYVNAANVDYYSVQDHRKVILNGLTKFVIAAISEIMKCAGSQNCNLLISIFYSFLPYTLMVALFSDTTLPSSLVTIH